MVAGVTERPRHAPRNLGPPFSFALLTLAAQTGDMPSTQHHRELDIARGQHFRARDGIVWEVSEIIRRYDELPHVALVKPQDRLTRKVISVDALFDKRLFSVVE